MPDQPRRPIRPVDPARRRPRADQEAGAVAPRGPAPVERPDIPPVVGVRLPRGLVRAIRQQVRDAELAEDVADAVAAGAALLEDERGEQAVALLAWAKRHAPRIPEVREGLGVAHYQAGQYRSALKELRTYRRMTAMHDQDHLVADCLRGLGRAPVEVAAEVEAMLAADGVAPERQVEGLLVWAGARRDHGDLPGARAVLRRADPDLVRRAGEDARQRLAWLAADLAEADGDRVAAREGFRELARLPDDPWEAGARLAGLD